MKCVHGVEIYKQCDECDAMTGSSVVGRHVTEANTDVCPIHNIPYGYKQATNYEGKEVRICERCEEELNARFREQFKEQKPFSIAERLGMKIT